MTIDGRVEQVFRDVFGNNGLQIEAHTTAEDIPEWDSIAHINLIVGIEQVFGVHFGSQEIAAFENVGDLVEALRDKGAL